VHHPIDRSETPIRLFKSNFMEFFTHISPLAVIILWLPVIVFFLVRAMLNRDAGGFPWHIPLGFLLGLFLWTFAEYTLHRFVFHYRPRNAWQERVTYLFHGIHHHQPHIKTRLVMPPAVSIPLAFLFYGLFYLVGAVLLKAPQWVDPLVAGFMLGYLTYDLIHYATHHFPMKRGYLKYLRKYHMQHHYKTPDARYGVSSPIWDYVFRTKPQEG
jgi:sterol desaturase/sphingolipid hydroxylase (fatty acid hydroxylase superfamily)